MQTGENITRLCKKMGSSRDLTKRSNPSTASWVKFLKDTADTRGKRIVENWGLGEPWPLLTLTRAQQRCSLLH
jgi:hypothetical protein